MKRAVTAIMLAFSTTAFGLAACSENTQQDAAEAANLAAEDAEANAEVVGEVLEEGAKDATAAISEGAADLNQRLEEGDEEEPGPAPIIGDDLSE